MRYDRNQILDALRQVGLKEGTNTFISTSLGMLGIVEGIKTSDDLNRLFFECITEVVGASGTVFVPAYSYTFGGSTSSNPSIFNPKTTPSRIGPFPEFFRQQPGVIRSHDPMMSVSGLGPLAEEIFKDIPPTSYGADSVFARMINYEIKCCNIGLGPNWTAFIHHSDWLEQVPFRYDKIFSGIIETGGDQQQRSWLYSAPIRNKRAESNAHRVGRLAEKAGIWAKTDLGRGSVYSADYRQYFDFVMEKFKGDKWLLAFGPAGDPEEIDRERIKCSRPEVVLAGKSPRSWPKKIAHLPRLTISDSTSAVIAEVAKDLDLDVHRLGTGKNIRDWVIPESWAAYRGQIVCTETGKVLTESKEVSLNPYSIAFNGEVTKDQLLIHLNTDPHNKEGIPSGYNLREKDWSFNCTHGFREELPNSRFKVDIETDFYLGKLDIAEGLIKGESDESILLCCYVGGPNKVNENLSGVLAVSELMTKLRQESNLYFSYRVVVLSDFLGLQGYKHLLEDDDRGKILYGLNLHALGQRGDFVLESNEDVDKSWAEIMRAEFRIGGEERACVKTENTFFLQNVKGNNPICSHQVFKDPFPIYSLYRGQSSGTLPFYGYGSHLDDSTNINTAALDQSVSDLYETLVNLDRKRYRIQRDRISEATVR